MKTKHFSHTACALAFAGLTAFPTGVFADSYMDALRQQRERFEQRMRLHDAEKQQRDAALAAEIAARKAKNNAMRERMNDPLPPIEGVAKADPSETACKLAYHQAVLDVCKKKGARRNCPFPKSIPANCYTPKKSKAPAEGIPAPKDWATQEGLLPSTPQPAPTGTGNGPTCTVRFADGTTTTVPDGSFIIPDTQTLYYVGATTPCTITPWIRLTPRDDLSATVGGGRYKVPAPQGPTPAMAALANPATATALTEAFTALSGLFAGWIATHAATLIATGTGAAIILTAEAAGEAPTMPEVEAAQARLAQPATERAERLSNGGPGDCDPDDLSQMQEAMKNFCDAPEHGAVTCSARDTPLQLETKARVRAICARMRENIMNQCFDGGNRKHRDQASGHWSAVRECLRLFP
jgi:hypothetical protein